jgi:DNA invertase Pin-like site-specific DNA recombinase
LFVIYSLFLRFFFSGWHKFFLLRLIIVRPSPKTTQKIAQKKASFWRIKSEFSAYIIKIIKRCLIVYKRPETDYDRFIMEKRCAIYARVSTVNGHQSPDAQLRDLRKYAEGRDWKVVDEFIDRISSGKEKRPGLEKMMQACRGKQVDAVLVWRFDRFARSTSELEAALREFQRLNIAFVSFSESIDTGTTTGKLVFTILGAVAEMERSIIRERVRAGLRNAVAKGRKLGGKRTPGKGKRLGRPKGRKDSQPRHTENPVDMLQVYKLRSENLSYRAIAKKLGVGFMPIFNLVKRDKTAIADKGGL